MKKSLILCATLCVVIAIIIFSCKRLDVPVTTGTCLTITQTSGTATAAQTVIVNTPIAPITYTAFASLAGTDSTSADTAHVSFSGSLPPGVTAALVNGVFTISGTPTTTTGSPFTYTVTTTGATCSATPITGAITVAPVGSVTIPTISGPGSICINNPSVLTGSGTPAAVNPWVSGTTLVATINNSGLITGVGAGTTLITYTNNTGGSVTQIVTVNAVPSITGTVNMCGGNTTILTGSGPPAAVNAWLSSDTTVAKVTNESGVVTGILAGTSTITYTNSNGCTTTTIVSVSPQATITGALNVTVGNSTSLTGSGTPAASTPWYTGMPSIATVTSGGSVTGVAAGTTIVVYHNSNGCDATQIVTVTP